MLTALIEFFKKHTWLTTIVVAVISSIGTYFFTLEQNRVDRFEASMMAEYQSVAASKRELYTALDQFTAALAKGKKPSPDLLEQMNAKLLDLHQRVDFFNIGLGAEDQVKIAAVKSALASMKIEIARAKTKSDLQYVAGSVAMFEGAYKAVRPIVERKIGMPSEMLSG